MEVRPAGNTQEAEISQRKLSVSLEFVRYFIQMKLHGDAHLDNCQTLAAYTHYKKIKDLDEFRAAHHLSLEDPLDMAHLLLLVDDAVRINMAIAYINGDSEADFEIYWPYCIELVADVSPHRYIESEFALRISILVQKKESCTLPWCSRQLTRLVDIWECSPLSHSQTRPLEMVYWCATSLRDNFSLKMTGKRRKCNAPLGEPERIIIVAGIQKLRDLMREAQIKPLRWTIPEDWLSSLVREEFSRFVPKIFCSASADDPNGSNNRAKVFEPEDYLAISEGNCGRYCI
jgi:hypothetical protein